MNKLILNTTISGVDVRTPLVPLAEMLIEYGRGVEMAFLYSAKRAGIHPRYPTLQQIAASLELMTPLLVRTAIHVCGSGAREELLEGDEYTRYVFGLPDRIQINGEVDSATVTDAMSRHHRGIVTQWVPGLKSFASAFHSCLFDGSGGHGITPGEWIRPPSNGLVCAGFAGGLGPHNLETELPRILSVADQRFDWIDMESGVRTDDWLDLSKVRRVLEIMARGCDGEASRE